MKLDFEGTLLGRLNSNVIVIYPTDDGYINYLANKLHTLATSPDVYVEVIDESRGFKQTDLNIAINTVIEML